MFFYTQFIGMPAKSVSRRSFLLYPYLRVVSEEEECSVVLKSVDSLSLEHIYAIMVEYCLSIGKQRDPGAVPFPVLSVPSFVSSSFLRNISYAMQITGTQQYATLQASLAVALDFSYYLNKDGWFASYSPSRPFSFLLVDVGFFSTECSLFLFWPDHVERVAFNYRMDCGGDRCTWVIFSLLSDAYARFVGPFPETQSKTLLAYYVMAEGVKHDLSLKGLNETTIFIEDEHSLTITAAEVDKAICEEGLLEDTLECVYACIKDAALPAVDRIECVGGASRAPYVKKAVEAACSKKGWVPNFTYTLNADRGVCWRVHAVRDVQGGAGGVHGEGAAAVLRADKRTAGCHGRHVCERARGGGGGGPYERGGAARGAQRLREESGDGESDRGAAADVPTRDGDTGAGGGGEGGDSEPNRPPSCGS